MPGRSLQLSEAGQQQARQALLVRNLTQKAIANELAIASWSTVSKFFNGKPVDRFIFQEICTVLGLEWVEVVEGGEVGGDRDGESLTPPLPTHTSTHSKLITATQAQATAAREALNPRILERIPRAVVREKYLGAIARGIHEQKERLIAIIGPAGYGKSTILGDIYDELLAAETPWVGLVLCSSLSLSTSYLGFMSYGLVASTMAGPVPTGPSQNQQEMIANALGQSLCGESRSVVEVCQDLHQTMGRGGLLIDTLDLVINRDFVVAFGVLMRQVLAGGTTVVFTCRDHEYNDYLEPVNERLPGLSQAADRYSVPNFSTAEIRAAAVAFFRTLAPDQPERGQAFADKVLALSTDNRSLREILESPLLLALLCDLFGEAGDVPPDLTVSKLYQRYWQEKVAYSRIDQSHYAPLAMEKEALCLGVAQRLFELSESRLCESFYRDDLGLSFTPQVLAAYNDLLSEGVLTPLGSGKVHFFHQTLLEYAIAYWLTRQSATAQRHRFFEQLQQPDAQAQRTHWLPVLRQYLAIVDQADFAHCLEILPLEHLGIFSAVAHGAVARESSQGLEHLLPLALNLGDAYQKRLGQALEAAPHQLTAGGWPIVITLLRAGNHATAINTAKSVGWALTREASQLGSRLSEALAAIAERSLAASAQSHKGKDDRALVSGWLLQHCLPVLVAQPDPALLEALHPYCLGLGQDTLAAIVELHLEPTIPLATRQSLIHVLEATPLLGHRGMETAVTELLYSVYAANAAEAIAWVEDADPWPSWYRRLMQPRLVGWDKVYARTLGAQALAQLKLLKSLLSATLPRPNETPHPQSFRLYYMALEETVTRGGGEHMLRYGMDRAPESIHPVALKPWLKFLRLIGASLSATTQDRVAQWLRPQMCHQPKQLLPLLEVLVAAPTAQALLTEILEDLPPSERDRYRARLLQFQPIDQHPPLSTLEKSGQVVLVKFYRTQAMTDAAATQKLLSACQSHFKDVATAASYGIAQDGVVGLTLPPLLALLNSRFAGVQAQGASAIARPSQGGKTLSRSQVTELAQHLAKSKNQAVVRPLCQLITTWVRHHQQVPEGFIEIVGTIPQRLQPQGTWDGGVAKVMIAAFKAMAQSQSPGLDSQALGQKIRQLLMAIDLIAVPHGEAEMIDVLSALDRLDRGVLGHIVEYDCPLLSERGWLRNLSTVIRTLRRVENSESDWFDQILQASWCTAEVASVVLEAKGV